VKTFLLLLLSLQLQAREIVEMAYDSFLDQSEVNTRVRLGAPPLNFLRSKMINSISYSEISIQELSLVKNQTLLLKELSWSPLIFFDWNENWTATWGMNIANRSQGEDFTMNSKTFALSQFINFSPKDQSPLGWTWSWGLFIPDRSLQSPVFPGISFSYLSEDKKWNWQFRGPSVVKTYSVSDKWQWISKFYFRSGSYRVDPDGPWASRGSYIQSRQTRIETGLKTFSLKPVILSLQAGYQLRGNLQVVNSQDKNHNNISERSAAFLDLSLSLAAF